LTSSPVVKYRFCSTAVLIMIKPTASCHQFPPLWFGFRFWLGCLFSLIIEEQKHAIVDVKKLDGAEREIKRLYLLLQSSKLDINVLLYSDMDRLPVRMSKLAVG